MDKNMWYYLLIIFPIPISHLYSHSFIWLISGDLSCLLLLIYTLHQIGSFLLPLDCLLLYALLCPDQCSQQSGVFFSQMGHGRFYFLLMTLSFLQLGYFTENSFFRGLCVRYFLAEGSWSRILYLLQLAEISEFGAFLLVAHFRVWWSLHFCLPWSWSQGVIFTICGYSGTTATCGSFGGNFYSMVGIVLFPTSKKVELSLY